LLTAFGLTHGGNNTVHIYIQTIHRTAQLQGKDGSKPAGNWIQLLMVLFTKEYLPTSVLFFFLILNFRLWSSLLRQHGFRTLSPIAFQARPPSICLEKGAWSGYQSTLCRSFPTRLLIIRSVGAEWIFAYKQAGRGTDRYDEAISRFSLL